jgi:hypothetical protein
MPIGTQHLPLYANYRRCGWWRLLTLLRWLAGVNQVPLASVSLLHFGAAPGTPLTLNRQGRLTAPEAVGGQARGLRRLTNDHIPGPRLDHGGTKAARTSAAQVRVMSRDSRHRAASWGNLR